MFEDLIKLNRSQYKPVPLKKSNDVDFEVQWQTKELTSLGHQVVHVARTKFDETVLVYRLLFSDGHDDEIIMLRARIITDRGVRVHDPRMHLHYDAPGSHIRIADIKIEAEDANRGYGSVFMEALFTLLNQMHEPVKYVSGWISSVDWDHIERSVHFYEKHGFTCSVDHELRDGDIIWVNPNAGGSIEEFRALNLDASDRLPEGGSKCYDNAKTTLTDRNFRF